MTGSAGKKLGRREAALTFGSFAAMCLASSSGCGSTTTTTKPTLPPKTFGGPVEVWSWFDLPDDPRSRELSGIAWDETTRVLWAVQDEASSIVSILPDRELKKWSFGPSVELKLTFPLDLEGLVVTSDGFVVASEIGPRVLEVDRKGNLRRDIPLPAHFSKARENKSIESLTMSPGGRYLFTTTEGALSSDGGKATPSLGTRVRILRVAMDGGETIEHAYATDPLPHPSGDYGVADLAALSSDDLLVLERGWTRGSGNTARVYRASLADARSSCLESPELAPNAPVMEKRLLVDLAKLVVRGLPPARQQQDAPILDNFEGLAIGPRLPDGRNSLVIVSDDNNRTDQFARIVVLAVG